MKSGGEKYSNKSRDGKGQCIWETASTLEVGVGNRFGEGSRALSTCRRVKQLGLVKKRRVWAWGADQVQSQTSQWEGTAGLGLAALGVHRERGGQQGSVRSGSDMAPPQGARQRVGVPKEAAPRARGGLDRAGLTGLVAGIQTRQSLGRRTGKAASCL